MFLNIVQKVLEMNSTLILESQNYEAYMTSSIPSLNVPHPSLIKFSSMIAWPNG